MSRNHAIPIGIIAGCTVAMGIGGCGSPEVESYDSRLYAPQDEESYHYLQYELKKVQVEDVKEEYFVRDLGWAGLVNPVKNYNNERTEDCVVPDGSGVSVTEQGKVIVSSVIGESGGTLCPAGAELNLGDNPELLLGESEANLTNFSTDYSQALAIIRKLDAKSDNKKYETFALDGWFDTLSTQNMELVSKDGEKQIMIPETIGEACSLSLDDRVAVVGQTATGINVVRTVDRLSCDARNTDGDFILLSDFDLEAGIIDAKLQQVSYDRYLATSKEALKLAEATPESVEFAYIEPGWYDIAITNEDAPVPGYSEHCIVDGNSEFAGNAKVELLGKTSSDDTVVRLMYGAGFGTECTKGDIAIIPQK